MSLKNYAKQYSARITKGRKILKEVTKYLNVGDESSRTLWHILTGLRGPDNSQTPSRVKANTTSKIRFAIGLKDMKVGATVVNEMPDIKFGSYYNFLEDHKDVTIDAHFANHAASAISGLEKFRYYRKKK